MKVYKFFILIVTFSPEVIIFAKDYTASRLLENYEQAKYFCPKVCEDHGKWNGNFLVYDQAFRSGVCGCNK